MKIDVEKGRMLGSPVHWIYFVLRNTDIMTRLNNAPLRLQRIDDRVFTGAIFGAKVTLEVLGDRSPSAQGEVDIVADVRMPLLLGRTHTVVKYRYQVIDDETSMIDLRFILETRGIIMGIYAFLRRVRINTYINKVLDDNEKAASLIRMDDESLTRFLTDEQLTRIKAFRANYEVEEAAMLQETSSLEREAISKETRPIWDAELRELAVLYRGVQGRASQLRDELDRITKTRDAVATLLTARRMLEVIVTQLCEKVLNRPRGSEPLAAVIDKLARVDYLPAYVFTSMQNLNRLSTYGAHPKEFSPRQVRESLMALCSVVEWYVSEGSRICNADEAANVEMQAPSSAEMEFRFLCQGVWLDGVVSDLEREMLEKKRIELGLSREDAERIELSCVPEEQCGQDNIVSDNGE